MGSDPVAFRWESAPLVRAVSRATVDAFRRIGRMGEQEARARAHVVTGKMRDHVFSEVDVGADGRVVLVLGDDVENDDGFPYGAVEELRPGHAFLRPAIDAVAPRIPGELAASARGRGF